jgi:hypothetical protein
MTQQAANVMNFSTYRRLRNQRLPATNSRDRTAGIRHRNPALPALVRDRTRAAVAHSSWNNVADNVWWASENDILSAHPTSICAIKRS